ncbi:hypothetical protein [Geothrix sp. 21YS21S-4]|uniref:hypothetical protein n=1 Tax=Geothrix sp. 21YS21S-4 TaxID=3068889 RepID=UPI0027B960EF|nr:hypothetical protein [Geothrix sp. 21YS21S-4]
MMNLRGLGNLAKILEEAAKPDSVLREDREKPKPKVLKKGEKVAKTRTIDPKRKVWYEKRLKEVAAKTAVSDVPAAGPVTAPIVSPAPALTKSVASKVGGSLLQTLAAAKDAKPKIDGPKRSEAWRRKPGESIF